MNIPELVFLTGPIGAPLLAPLSVTAIAVVKGPRWVFVILGAALTAVVAWSFIAYWFLWGKAFDYADANKLVPARLDLASNVNDDALQHRVFGSRGACCKRCRSETARTWSGGVCGDAR